MILVTGATGTVGREVVAQLLAAGQKVRMMTRDPSKVKLDGGVQVVQGDFDVPQPLASKRVFGKAILPRRPRRQEFVTSYNSQHSAATMKCEMTSGSGTTRESK